MSGQSGLVANFTQSPVFRLERKIQTCIGHGTEKNEDFFFQLHLFSESGTFFSPASHANTSQLLQTAAAL